MAASSPAAHAAPSPDAGPRFRSALTARPTTPAIGADLSGLDLSKPLSDDERQDVLDALHAFQVVFFHDQRLSNAELSAFARLFGEPQPANESSFDKDEAFPEIDVLAFGGGRRPYNTQELWHTDFSGRAMPTLGSVLYCLEAPSSGGDTIWASGTAAYDALSDKMKAYLDGMQAEHRTIKAFGDEIRSNLWKDEKGRKRLQELQALPPAEHPVIRTHPVTGRKALFINEGFTERLLGVSRKESDAVLGYLFEHTRVPEFQVRFRWKAGDLAVWDNRVTQHYAVSDYTERRVMHRITIRGDRPF
jgi:taurine dioxygenase